MDTKVDSYSALNQTETLPSYNEVATPIQISNSQVKPYSTYTIHKSGCFKKHFKYINDQEPVMYHCTAFFRSAKFLINEEEATIKLNHGPFAFATSTWDVEYLIKNPEVYSKITMVKKTFQLVPTYSIEMTRYHGQIDYYEIRPTNFFATDWILIRKGSPQNILMKYNHYYFKKNKLEVFETIPEEDFKLFLLFLSFIVTDEQRRKNAQSSGGGP